MSQQSFYLLLAVFFVAFSQGVPQITDCTQPIPTSDGTGFYDISALIGTSLEWKKNAQNSFVATVCKDDIKPCGTECPKAGYCSHLSGAVNSDFCYGCFGYATPLISPAEGVHLVYDQCQYAVIGKVSIFCDPSAGAVSNLRGASDGGTLEFESKYACKPRGLSGGSIMMIILLVLLIVYLVGGVAYNKFKEEKDGIELIPNLEFWQAVPGLVVEGFQFTISKIRGN